MILVALFLIILFFPHEALAWGPITHIDYASQALQQVMSYGPTVKALLTAYPHDFLYGTLAADITIGKDYVDYIYNCHNWRVGFQIFEDAKEDRQKAAALGYLSHLAVDIVSHNFFVPYKTIRSYSTRTLGHVYWEVRFDSMQPKKNWNLAKEISKLTFPHNDQLFQRMVKPTLFSFGTNKVIFKSVLTLHRLERWKMLLEKVSEGSKFKFDRTDFEEYRRLAIYSVTTFLRQLDRAPCTLVDPTGEKKLTYANAMRKKLKALSRQKNFSEEKANVFLADVKDALRRTLYHPEPLPQIENYF